jgi:hypothetical protein
MQQPIKHTLKYLEREMMAAKNHRVYLVLDLGEAEAVEHLISKPPAGPSLERIIARLRAAMGRAKEKGARLQTMANRR